MNKKSQPQEGKWRLVYNTKEDWYRIREARGVLNTNSKNKVEHLDSEEECIIRIYELGITFPKV